LFGFWLSESWKEVYRLFISYGMGGNERFFLLFCGKIRTNKKTNLLRLIKVLLFSSFAQVIA